MDIAENTLRNYLNELLDDINYKIRDVEIKPITSGGANYTSGLFKVTVTSPGKETLHLFSKVAIMGGQLKEVMMLDELFLTERIVYEDLQKAYENLQTKYRIPENERFKFAKYYSSCLKPNSELFVLEDLNVKGYQIYNRFDALKWDHVSENIKTLAHFHALSFVLEKEMPEIFEKCKSFRFPVDLMKDMFSGPVEIMLEGLSEFHRTKMLKFMEDMGGLKAAADLYEPFGRNVIIHGDYRPSNIMYKQEGDDVTVLPVDYQTVRVGCAMSDLVYFLITATDGEFRTAHFHQLLDLYHSHLGRRLSDMNVDVDEVYPREQFDKELRKMLPSVLLFSLAMYPVLFVPAEAAPRVDGAAASLDDFRVHPNRQSTARLQQLIDDFIRWGLL